MPWRFLPYAERSGAENMAIDELLLDDLIAGTGAPTLRLYGFTPAAVSVGLNQKLDDDTVARIKSAGLDLVRRPTGGRAVLHQSDLTYSFVGLEESRGGPLKSSVTSAYKQICQGLILALRELGVPTELGESHTAYRHLADCFLATTPADLHHKGRKIAGSAQLRRKGVVLQHGSLPLLQAQESMSNLLDADSGVAAVSSGQSLGSRHVNLFELIAQSSCSDLNEPFRRGFEVAFNVELKTQELTAQELERALTRKPEFTQV